MLKPIRYSSNNGPYILVGRHRTISAKNMINRGVVSMRDAKGKYIGAPKITVHILPATPEAVAQTRENVERALSSMYSEINGYPTRATVQWPDGPTTNK